MMSRVPIKTAVRFEVFKRDSFTCQYCGDKAPDVVLEVDHIVPVAGGGTNEILNLVTACRQCNAGKKDRRLSDSAAIEKSRSQAEDLQDRKNQLEMIAKWHLSLVDIESAAVDQLESLWFSCLSEVNKCLTRDARDELQRLVKKFGFESVCKAVSCSASRLIARGCGGDSAARDEAFWCVGKICAANKADDKDPGVSRLFYIRGILRNRTSAISDGSCIAFLKEARSLGVDVSWMECVAKEVTSWSQFRNIVGEEISGILQEAEEEAYGQDTQH
jgi:hypothetical protein